MTAKEDYKQQVYKYFLLKRDPSPAYSWTNTLQTETSNIFFLFNQAKSCQISVSDPLPSAISVWDTAASSIAPILSPDSCVFLADSSRHGPLTTAERLPQTLFSHLQFTPKAKVKCLNPSKGKVYYEDDVAVLCSL